MPLENSWKEPVDAFSRAATSSPICRRAASTGSYVQSLEFVLCLCA